MVSLGERRSVGEGGDSRALQEVARNVDTYALASKKGELVPTPTLAKELDVAAIDARALFDASRNAGQKAYWTPRVTIPCAAKAVGR